MPSVGLTLSAANLSFSANLCFKVNFFLGGAAVVVGAAVFFGFSESETSQSSCLLAFILYLSPSLPRPLLEHRRKVEARTKERPTSSDSSLSSSCHFDLAEGLGKTGAGGVEVPEVGSSISTISPLSLFQWWTYPSRPLCIM
jgi:hypothetical protein